MLGSLVVYAGLVVAAAGLALSIKPIRRLRVTKRSQGLRLLAAGVAVALVGMLLPAPESRVDDVATRLDELAPAWQFHEFHSIRIDAPPDRVFEAIERVRADEIALFRTLTWIRRGGRDLPPGVLNPGRSEPLIEVAIRGGFVRLAYDPPDEIVIGSAVMVPTGSTAPTTPEAYRGELPPGFVLATMNFLVRADGPNRSVVTTETRVFANNDAARRRFAAYWRVIYPGSAIIRRMWLRAIERRATGS